MGFTAGGNNYSQSNNWTTIRDHPRNSMAQDGKKRLRRPQLNVGIITGGDLGGLRGTVPLKV